MQGCGTSYHITCARKLREDGKEGFVAFRALDLHTFYQLANLGMVYSLVLVSMSLSSLSGLWTQPFPFHMVAGPLSLLPFFLGVAFLKRDDVWLHFSCHWNLLTEESRCVTCGILSFKKGNHFDVFNSHKTLSYKSSQTCAYNLRDKDDQCNQSIMSMFCNYFNKQSEHPIEELSAK